jgi:flavodoxin
MAMERRILLNYYSRMGNTRSVALELAGLLRCDVEEIRDTRNRLGKWGWLVANVQATIGGRTVLRPVENRPEDYDLVIVGTPVWNSSLSVPIRTYLEQYSGSFREVAFFLTHGGTGRARVFRQMGRAAGRDPAAVLSIKASEIRARSASQKLADFARILSGP